MDLNDFLFYETVVYIPLFADVTLTEWQINTLTDTNNIVSWPVLLNSMKMNILLNILHFSENQLTVRLNRHEEWINYNDHLHRRQVKGVKVTLKTTRNIPSV